MQSLFIEPGDYSPYISFNQVTGTLKISGESYMEHPYDFYEPVISWVHHFLATNRTSLKLDFYLKYFNTGSSQALFEIFDILEAKTNPSVINWHVEQNDPDILAEGEGFQEDFPNLYFNIVHQ